MNNSAAKVTIFTLLLLVTTHEVSAATNACLLKAVKTDSDGESRIAMDFSGLPAYLIKSSGQRVDLYLQHTKLDPVFQELPEDSTLVQMEKQSYKHKLILSFLFRRPPQQIDASFTPHLPLKNSSPPGSVGHEQLVLTIYWKPPPPILELTPDVTKSRPALAQGVIGKTTAGLDKVTASRRISSDYSGQWPIFFEKYQSGVHIPPVLHYSLSPFPCLELLAPNSRIVARDTPLAAVYQAAVRKGRAEDWHQAASLLQEVMNRQEHAIPPGFKLLYGESLLHAGEFAKGREVLANLTDTDIETPESICAQYLTFLALAATGQPYEAAYGLNELKNGLAKTNPLVPYLRLLDAEIALAIGRAPEALRLLGEQGPVDSGPAREMYNLRRADGLAATGCQDEGLSIYRKLAAESDLLLHHPFSLTQFAGLLYQRQEFEPALKYYIKLAANLFVTPGRDLALFRAAMCQLKSGRSKEAQLLFEDIITNFPDSEGAFRARLKKNDLLVIAKAAEEKKKTAQTANVAAENQAPASPTDAAKPDRLALLEKYFPGSIKRPEKKVAAKIAEFDPALEYAAISSSAPLRELREEAAFKQALVLYLRDEPLQAAELLRSFLRDNANGLLKNDATDLLAELLPLVIQDRIREKEYISALVLAEQNRPLLLSGQVRGDFLAELGLAFAGLCFWNRAVRVYLYMMDIAKGKTEEEKVYHPLINAYFEAGDYAEVEKYAANYNKLFPEGDDCGQIWHLRLKALRNSDQTDKAIELLRAGNLPENRELLLFAGHLLFETGEYAEAGKYLEKAIGADLSNNSADDIVLWAEALFRSGNGSKALPLYQHLREDTTYGDQAVYRLAQIEMASADTPAGLNLLQSLVEKGKSPLWRKLAAETLVLETP